MKTANKNHEIVYSEMGQKTTAQIEFVCSYGGGYAVHTNLELKGRGIRQTGDGSNHKRNLKGYHVTELALEKLKTQYSTAYMANL
tara:strand:- start:898 stop:1152 length:255 start_codon:yes stop_codon:yes gene_type:complete